LARQRAHGSSPGFVGINLYNNTMYNRLKT
jgi:hypothetical protein